MLKITAYAIPRLILPAVLFFGAQAFAQFEIAPDHFDSTDQKGVTKNKVKPAQNATSSSPQGSHVVTATAAHPVRKQIARHRVSARKTSAGGDGQNSVAGTRIAAVRRKRTSTNNAVTVSP